MSSGAESATRKAVRERSGGICELSLPDVCRGRAENISHRQAVGQGGEWSASNCMDACGSGTTGCHGWVEGNPFHAWVLGLRVRRPDTPAKVAVKMRTAQWPYGYYLLRDDGTLTPC